MSSEFDTYRELKESQSPGEAAADASRFAHFSSHSAFHAPSNRRDNGHKLASAYHAEAAELHARAAKEVNDHHAEGAALKHYHTVTAEYHRSLAKLHGAPSQFNTLIPKRN